jgi:hypothetical protein
MNWSDILAAYFKADAEKASEPHVHKFNGTLISGHGRCSCGAWASYQRSTRSYGEPFSGRYAKGLETRLRRLQDPNFEYPRIPNAVDSTPEEYQPTTTPDIVAVFEGKRKRTD